MYIYIYSHIYTYIYIFIYTHVLACIHIHIYMYTYTYIYIYICIYTFIPVQHHSVAPLRMGVRRAAPGGQLLPDFEVISCPWRAASADQGSLSGPLLGKRPWDFSVRIQNLWETAKPLITAQSLFERHSNRNFFASPS